MGRAFGLPLVRWVIPEASFKKFGFLPTEKKKLPQKIWTDCSICPKFAKCDEIAYVKEL